MRPPVAPPGINAASDPSAQREGRPELGEPTEMGCAPDPISITVMHGTEQRLPKQRIEAERGNAGKWQAIRDILG